jgi:hypothetical protein
MATTLQKIQDTAGRIDRLGKYTASVSPSIYRSAPMLSAGPCVFKDKGVLQLFKYGRGSGVDLICVPREGRIVHPNGTPEPQESGLTLLEEFEKHLLGHARRIAREEVIQELVERKIRRVTKPKTRGFKADMKKRAKKAAPKSE